MRFRSVCLNDIDLNSSPMAARIACALIATLSLALNEPGRLSAQVLRNQRGAVSGNKLPEGPVVDIQIEGNSTVDKEEILRKLSSRIGRPLERKIIEKDIRALLESNWFSDVQPFYDKTEDDKGYVLIFKVREMQKIGGVEYRGASAIKVRKLEEATGIKPGSRVDGIKARLGIAAIERLYQEKGYHKVSVKLVSGDKPGDTSVVYEIFEGPKYTISHVEILGNSYVSDGVLKTKIQSKPSILGLLGGSFSREQIEDDARKLREYYQGQGFFEIAVSVVDEPGENLGHRKVTFVISEGPQYKVRDIRFEGNDKIAVESLRDGLALHSNQPFRDDYRDADKKKLLSKYGEIGCIDAKIDVEPKFTTEPGIVDLVYKIEEGDQYLLGEIIVKGNDRSKDKIIRREAEMAGLVPGEPLNANLLQTFQKRLEGTQYFVASPEMGKPINVNIINRRAHDKPYGEGVIPVSLMSGDVTRLQDPGSELPSSSGTVPLGAPNEKPIQIAQAPASGGAATPAPILDGSALPPVVEGGNAIGGAPIGGNAIVVPPPSVITIPGMPALCRMFRGHRQRSFQKLFRVQLRLVLASRRADSLTCRA